MLKENHLNAKRKPVENHIAGRLIYNVHFSFYFMFSYLSIRRKSLKLHVEREHLKIRYTCEKCEKVVSTKTILKEHLKLHNDEKNYKCDQCNKEFK